MTSQPADDLQQWATLAGYQQEFDKLSARIRRGVQLRREQREREFATEDVAALADARAFIGPWPDPPHHPHQRAADVLLIELDRRGMVHGFDAQLLFGHAMGRPFDPSDADRLLELMLVAGIIRKLEPACPTLSQRANSCSALAKGVPQGRLGMSWHYYARGEGRLL